MELGFFRWVGRDGHASVGLASDQVASGDRGLRFVLQEGPQRLDDRAMGAVAPTGGRQGLPTTRKMGLSQRNGRQGAPMATRHDLSSLKKILAHERVTFAFGGITRMTFSL